MYRIRLEIAPDYRITLERIRQSQMTQLNVSAIQIPKIRVHVHDPHARPIPKSLRLQLQVIAALPRPKKHHHSRQVQAMFQIRSGIVPGRLIRPVQSPPIQMKLSNVVVIQILARREHGRDLRETHFRLCQPPQHQLLVE
jgi:hypothetical protein